jgi:hypothetical protein
MCADLFGRWQKSTWRSGRLVRIAHFQASLVRRVGGLRTVGLARPSLPAPRPPHVAFHVLSSAEAALGASFDLERIGLRAVRDSVKKVLDVENQGVTVCETYL